MKHRAAFLSILGLVVLVGVSASPASARQQVLPSEAVAAIAFPGGSGLFLNAAGRGDFAFNYCANPNWRATDWATLWSSRGAKWTSRDLLSGFSLNAYLLGYKHVGTVRQSEYPVQRVEPGSQCYSRIRSVAGRTIREVQHRQLHVEHQWSRYELCFSVGVGPAVGWEIVCRSFDEYVGLRGFPTYQNWWYG